MSCGSQVIDFTVTLYATRAPAGATLDQIVAGVVQAIRTEHPTAKTYKGQAANMTMDGAPPMQAGRFTVHETGKDLWSYVAVSIVKGWIVEERVTGPLDTFLAMEGDHPRWHGS